MIYPPRLDYLILRYPLRSATNALDARQPMLVILVPVSWCELVSRHSRKSSKALEVEEEANMKNAQLLR